MTTSMTEQEWPWPHFRDVADGGSDRLRCPCCGVLHLAPVMMAKLEHLRADFGKPMAVTSGYRCAKHDAEVRAVREQSGTGVHETGRAVDVQVAGEDAYRLVALASKHGFTGVGVNQRGPWLGRFVHLDDADGELVAPGRFPRPALWTY